MIEFEIYELVNILGLILGVVFGFIAQKMQFCFSGGIKDYLLTKSTKRASSVVLAMITAIIFSYLASIYFELDFTQSVYYKQNVNYAAIILGGLLFGTGMVLSDGCSNRHLIKFAQGDLNSLVSLVFIGIFAYATTKGILGGFLNPFINNDTLIEFSSLIGNFEMNIFIVLILLFIILGVLTKKIKRVLSLWDGFLIGILISVAWVITGVLGSESMEREIDLSAISFVYPTGKTVELSMFYQVTQIPFSVCVLVGVILGAFCMSIVNRRYSFGCTSGQNINRLKYNIIGGSLMGVGGVLSIGCTIGQGLSGISTLAFASIIAISSIFISAVITAIILKKKDKLPMCFIFDWKDAPNDYQI